MRTTGVSQLWIDMVCATRDAALRERDILRRQVEKLEQELREARKG